MLLGFSNNLFSEDPPEPPKLVSVSYVPESSPPKLIIKWEPSSTTSVIGYIIYMVTSGGETVPCDSVNGRNTVTYEYLLGTTPYSPQSFRLTSKDASEQISQLTNAHTSIQLTYEFGECDLKILLKWSEYVGWTTPIKEHRIYRRTATTAYDLFAVLNSDVFEYMDSTIEAGQEYYYYVESECEAGYKALTNDVKIETFDFTVPSYMNVDNVSVKNDFVDIKFSVESLPDILEYKIQRAFNSNNGEFITISTVKNEGQTEFVFTDKYANVYETVNFYRIQAIHKCNHVVYTSEASCSVLLKGVNKDGDKVEHQLDWTHYEKWSEGVADYKIYGIFDNEVVLLDTRNYTNSSHIVDLEHYIKEWYKNKKYVTNKFCYYVEAHENLISLTRPPKISASNVACVYEKPKIIVPNAFNVTSILEVNRVFKPVVFFVDKDTYEFKVYDRFGMPIFKTKDIYEGWNGYLDGKFAPPQQYIYNINYTDFDGNKRKEAGAFHLFIE
jgi:gliding motility-associated-like protein